ncbi:GMC oxidoreductase [Periconia macrospinosa]|uniref:GMC oxidoreductase n=1 Tax=Periconia macrospinosa TaxID=97972 RepID=A0A2V1DFI4_9PLEO|nr:GMC oxidoreductase [Periconia macrospinosa]
MSRYFLLPLVLASDLVSAVPVSQPKTLHERALLGSSFGVPGRNYTFDYVVVGGGQAGLTVAARLAENPDLSIAVIEAGTFYELSNGNYSQLPGMDIQNAGKDADDWQPGNDWGFVTEPQEALLGVKAHYPRGKMLGGSSARNYMTYHPGTKGSYDMWAEQVGDDAYSFDKFYPYFVKSQNFTPPDMTRRLANSTPRYDSSRLGTKGKLDVIFPNWAGAYGTWAEKGLASIGVKSINGFQNGNLIGSSYSLTTINYDKNIRESSEVAFLQPELAKEYPNLLVFPSTMAKRILFGSSKRANGVEIDRSGFVNVLTANREVILSAGAFQSPQLLMVSGVGPEETLQKFNIPVIADRPGVGQNMLDHVLFGTTFRVNVETQSTLLTPAKVGVAVDQFKKGQGPLTNPSVDMFGWEKLPRNGTLSPNSTHASVLRELEYFSEDWPEVEYIAPGGYFGYSNNFAKGNPTDGYNYGSMISGLVATMSTGTVSIKSADAADAPLIDPKWLSHPVDQAVAIAAFKRTREIWAGMSEITIGDEYFPGTNVTSDDDIWLFIQKSFDTIFHASCTCKMGKMDDPMAVVDSKARVIGVQGLRVVDASSMALLPPGHPMSTIYALAEKISDDIKNS